MINCLIVDDERPAVELLKSYVEKIPSLRLVLATIYPEEALIAITEGKVQLAFSDIQMANVSGLDIAKAAKDKCKIVFTTAYSEYAVEGYEYEIVDYLLKPIRFPRFLQAVEKAERVIATAGNDEQEIYIKMGVKGKFQRIPIDEIDYIEAEGNYVAIYCAGKKTLANTTMKEVETSLPKNRFTRVHKSYIIQNNRVAGIEGNMVKLKGLNEPILLSDTYKAQLLDNIHKKRWDNFSNKK